MEDSESEVPPFPGSSDRASDRVASERAIPLAFGQEDEAVCHYFPSGESARVSSRHRDRGPVTRVRHRRCRASRTYEQPISPPGGLLGSVPSVARHDDGQRV